VHWENTQDKSGYDEILAELKELDKETVEFNGIQMKASQCYSFSLNPASILFNANCPDSLIEQVPAVLRKYFEEI
jgi:hypothetical protein